MLWKCFDDVEENLNNSAGANSVYRENEVSQDVFFIANNTQLY